MHDAEKTQKKMGVSLGNKQEKNKQSTKLE